MVSYRVLIQAREEDGQDEEGEWVTIWSSEPRDVASADEAVNRGFLTRPDQAPLVYRPAETPPGG